MSSSPYQILENRPIDQWKVTELKDELKKRKLPIKGLKDDLVRRLDEAVRIERAAAAAQQESEDDDHHSDSPPLVGQEIVQSPQGAGVNTGHVQVDGVKPFDQEIAEEDYVLVSKESSVVKETVVAHETAVGSTVLVTESVVSEVLEREQGFPSTEIPGENGNSETEVVSEKVTEDPKTQNSEYSKPTSEEEIIFDDAAAKIQVYEVSPNNLGSPVKCDSISTDCVSINEKIEIKDNIIADNVKLELLDNIKPEMVAPSSSSTIDPVGGESHPRPMDVEEPHLSNTSVEDINDTKADLDKKFDSMVDDVGYSEKLNLDRSSGDDSMEEDVLESKQVESKYRSSDDLGDGSEKIEVSDAKEEGGLEDVVGDDIRIDKKGSDANNDRSFAAEKRKFNDQALAGSNEPVKRQRRWNTESLKVPEPQSSSLLSPSTTPKEAFQSAASKGLSKVDTTNDDDALKERVVPPSPKAPTNSLRIDRFVRPFTLKAVQELLGKTGNVTSFWMDQIKTHCYVTYSSVEEAMETRNAVYNLQWPPNGGRLLLAEFVDPQEVKTRMEAPPTPVGSAAPVPAVPPTPPGGSQPQPSPRLPRQQQQGAGTAPSLPPPPPLANAPQARERLPLPPPPPLQEKPEPPIVTLDDLFRKTKATPRIYYLPLSEEQVATKLAAQGKSGK